MIKDRNPKTGRAMKRIALRPCTRGKNARGICAHKGTKGAKLAKKQNPPSGGPRDVTAYRMRLDKARGRLA